MTGKVLAWQRAKKYVWSTERFLVVMQEREEGISLNSLNEQPGFPMLFAARPTLGSENLILMNG
jgi:hypothetical protein